MECLPEPFNWRDVAKELPRENFSVLAYSQTEWGFSVVEWDDQEQVWRSDALIDKTYPRGYFNVWMYIPLLPKALPVPYMENVGS